VGTKSAGKRMKKKEIRDENHESPSYGQDLERPSLGTKRGTYLGAASKVGVLVEEEPKQSLFRKGGEKTGVGGKE